MKPSSVRSWCSAIRSCAAACLSLRLDSRGYGLAIAVPILSIAMSASGCRAPLLDPAHSGLSTREAERPDPQLAAAGAAVFRQVCSNCHGGAGRGSEWAPGLTEIGLTVSEVASLVRTGVDPPSMPAFADVLTEEETNAVAAYTVELRY